MKGEKESKRMETNKIENTKERKNENKTKKKRIKRR